MPYCMLILEIVGKYRKHNFLLMDKAYQDDKPTLQYGFWV